MTTQDPQRLSRPDGAHIAYFTVPCAESKREKPGVVWLGGLHSDMGGTKAMALDAWARAGGFGFTRFDYFGHGASTGAFRDGTISRWRDDALAVLDEVCEGPQVLVASSMGGWVGLLVALVRPKRVRAIQLLAPAPDFTEEMWADLPDEIKQQLRETGLWRRPSAYDDEPYEISMKLIEDGRKNLLLTGPVAVTCPVRILHGMADEDVPWRHSLKIVDCLQSGDVTVTFVKSGDHRLSDPANLARLIASVEGLVEATT